MGTLTDTATLDFQRKISPRTSHERRPGTYSVYAFTELPAREQDGRITKYDQYGHGTTSIWRNKNNVRRRHTWFQQSQAQFSFFFERVNIEQLQLEYYFCVEQRWSNHVTLVSFPFVCVKVSLMHMYISLMIF